MTLGQGPHLRQDLYNTHTYSVEPSEHLSDRRGVLRKGRWGRQCLCLRECELNMKYSSVCWPPCVCVSMKSY